MDYTLKFPLNELHELAARYIAGNNDRANEYLIEGTIGPMVKKRGWYTKPEFLLLCRWKTPRTQPRCRENDPAYIQEITSIALGTSSERLRIEVLTLLNGVSWPTASVLLHFAHQDRYPILDFRAVESLNITKPNAYDFDFWQEYVSICRGLAVQTGVDMRTLDRALWQHSREHPIVAPA